MSRQLEAAVLLVLGVVVIRLALEGGYLAYVKPSLFIPLLLTGGALIVLCVAALRRKAGSEGSTSGHPPPKTGLLLLAPVLAIVLIAPDPLGAFAVSRGSINSLAQDLANDLPPLEATDGQPVELSLSEFILRTLAEGDARPDGIPITLQGFVVTDDDAGAALISRFAISCCAADATPRQIKVTGLDVDWPEDTWIEVTGIWQGELAAEEPRIPELVVTEAREIRSPATPYEYATY